MTQAESRTTNRKRRGRERRHSWGGLGVTTVSFVTTWSLLALLHKPSGASAQQNFSSTSGSDASGGTSSGASDIESFCSTSYSNGGPISVSSEADVALLIVALGNCNGGDFNVTWNGLVMLDEPLVVGAQSRLTITGVPGSSGEDAVLDGNNATTIVELESGSSLELFGVTLQNARQGSGNGGAVNAEAEGTFLFARNTAFSNNMAVDGRGGALVLGAGGSATFEGCTLVGNRAGGYGGGVSTLGDATVLFDGCLLDKNEASFEGGAVHIDGPADVTFADSVLSGNTAGFSGGAVYGVDASVVVRSGSLFVNNSAVDEGAGLCLRDDCFLNITGSFLVNNTVYDREGIIGTGGAVKVQGDANLTAEVYVEDSYFEGNWAPVGGGMYAAYGSVLRVEGTAFHKNGAGRGGAGAEITAQGEAIFRECNFTQGWGFNGGGMSVEGCPVEVVDCRFEANIGYSGPGGLYAGYGADVKIDRCHFGNNTIDMSLGSAGGDGGAIGATESNLSVYQSVFEGNQAGQGTGVASSSTAVLGGGAVKLWNGANASFEACNFTENSAVDGGAVLLDSESVVFITDSALLRNKASRNGGAVAVYGGSYCEVTASLTRDNNATLLGGVLFFTDGIGQVVNVTFVANVVASGSGGAIAALSDTHGSNVTVRQGEILDNEASGHGGSLVAAGSSTHLNVSGPLVISENRAGGSGGAAYVFDGAVLSVFDVVVSDNHAEVDGGAVGAVDALLVTMSHCNLTRNSCGRGGGGLSTQTSNFEGHHVDFLRNEAALDGGGFRGFEGTKAQLTACYFRENTARLGGAISGYGMNMTATDCGVVLNAAERNGGGLRLSYGSTAVVIGGNISSNSAVYDGGGVALDASSDSYDTILTDSDAYSTLECRGEAVLEANEARERGGAFYVTRGSHMAWNSCTSTENSASLGTSIYASHAELELGGDSILAQDSVSTGALLYALDTTLEAHGATFKSVDSPAMVAVHMNGGSTMRALDCVFSGWQGPTVVLTQGQLEMDACRFDRCTATPLVSASESYPARIRNTHVGTEVYDSIVSSDDFELELAGNVQSCADDPCSTSGNSTMDDADATDWICSDGDVGVYCACYEATITGDEVCLGTSTSVYLEAPSEQLVAVETPLVESHLNLTTETDDAGQGLVIWRLDTVNASYTRQGLVWDISPNVGILEAGNNESVFIRGELEGTLNGLTQSKFRVKSLRSGQASFARLNTTFYDCTEGKYYDDNRTECIECDELDLSEGVECTEKGVLLTTLPLLEGYWRANNASTIIRECLHGSACQGASVIQSSDDYCASGYEGPYCAICEAGYGGDIAHGCHQCSASFKALMYVLVAIVAIIALGLLWLIFGYLVQDPSELEYFLGCSRLPFFDRVKKFPLQKLKVPIVVFQIVTQYADIVSVEYPRPLATFLTLVDFVNLDLGWLFSAMCVISLNFYGRLLFVTLGPLVLVAALGGTYIIARGRVLRMARLPKPNGHGMGSLPIGSGTMAQSRQLLMVKTKHMTVLMTLSFLVYSTTSTMVFQTFACDYMEEYNQRYLRADYSLLCGTSEHKSYMAYSIVMMLVYPVGIPVWYAWLLFSNRHRIFPKQALRDGVPAERRLTDRKIAHTVFLWEAYRPQRYYFEVIECARRLVLTGCLVFILPNTAGQAAVACVLSTVTVCIFIMLRPFLDERDFRSYVLGCLVIFMSMYMSLVVKVKIGSGDSQSQVVISYILIILSMALLVSAIAECFFEIRSTSRETPGLSDPSFTTLQTRKSGMGDGKSNSTMGKGLSPEGGPIDQTGASGLMDLVGGMPESNSSGDKAPSRVVGTGNSSNNSSNNRHSQQHHRSGSSAMSPEVKMGSTGLVSGFAVLDDSCNGTHELGGAGGGSSVDDASSSTNTYGPLVPGDDDLKTTNSSARGNGRSDQSFLSPSMTIHEDVPEPTDSPRMAEIMFAHRLGEARKGAMDPGSPGSSVRGAPTSATPNSNESSPHGTLGDGPVLTRLSPAGPSTNAFPMPPPNGQVEEALERSLRTNTVAPATSGGIVPPSRFSSGGCLPPHSSAEIPFHVEDDEEDMGIVLNGTHVPPVTRRQA